MVNFCVHSRDPDTFLTPHVCKTCIEHLRQWAKGQRMCLTFGIPVVWWDPEKHCDNCYFCLANIKSINWTTPSFDLVYITRGSCVDQCHLYIYAHIFELMHNEMIISRDGLELLIQKSTIICDTPDTKQIPLR